MNLQIGFDIGIGVAAFVTMGLHPYSYTHGSETDERTKIAYRLAGVSVLLSFLAYLALLGLFEFWQPADPAKSILKFLVTSPSLLGFFWLLHKKTNSCYWEKPFVRWGLGITVPNINGTWTGKVRTYYPDHMSSLRKARAVIWQDMQQIGICIDTPLHKIDSLGASIIRVADGWILAFHFLALRKLKRQEEAIDRDGPVVAWSELEQGANENEFKRDFFGHHTHVGNARVYIPDPERWPSTEGPCNFIKIQFYTDNRRVGFMELTRVDTLAFSVSESLVPTSIRPTPDGNM